MLYNNFDKTSLEREYSPSSCIDDINIFIKKYIEQSAKSKENAVTTNSLISDLAYGGSDREKLDLYLPTNGNNKKLHVFIHGGYWQELSKNEACFAAENFQKSGTYFAAIGYNLAPQVSVSKIVHEVRTAIYWLYQHAEQFGYDKNEIYLSGSSAGAHLALMTALTSWQAFGLPKAASLIRGVCLVSGIYDLTPLKHTYINDALQLNQSDIVNNSPLLMPKLRYQGDVIIAYGQNETSEFKRQSHALLKSISATSNTCKLNEIANRNHFDVILDLSNMNSRLCRSVFEQMNI